MQEVQAIVCVPVNPQLRARVKNQVVHLISSHHRWLDRLQLTKPAPHIEFDDFPTRSMVKTKWDEAKEEFMNYVYSLNQVDLEEDISYQIKNRSIDTTHSRWQILHHLINHSTDHRSQILTMLNTKFELDTPEQDFIIYLWELEQNSQN